MKMTTTVSIPGMHCESCGKLIRAVSEDFTEIQDLKIDLPNKRVVIAHGAAFDFPSWKAAIEGLGTDYAVKAA